MTVDKESEEPDGAEDFIHTKPFKPTANSNPDGTLPTREEIDEGGGLESNCFATPVPH